MDRPKLEVADVLRRYGEAYREQHAASLSTGQRRVMSAIELCRTAALGSHREHCDQCPYERTCYDSCRNRHCTKCQCLARAQGIEDRQSELLDTGYFHVVFTLPEEIAAIAYQNKKVVYDILFRATSETLRTIAVDPKHLGARSASSPYCTVGGRTCFFIPISIVSFLAAGSPPTATVGCPAARASSCLCACSPVFRRLFLELLQKAFDAGQLHFFSSLLQLHDPAAFAAYLDPLRKAKWVVYAKPPFAGPQQVLSYVGRYTHRVAISNNLLLDIENGQVQFRYKDYRNRSQQKVMPLSADEFIRRFLLHVLPDGFQRIRYYGFLSNRHREEKLERCRQLLGMASAHPTTPATEPPKDYRDRYEDSSWRFLRLCPSLCRWSVISCPLCPPSLAHPQP